MSTTFYTPVTNRARSRGSGLMATVKTWWKGYIVRRIEQAAIIQLHAMSDRELQDIGLARSQIEEAVRGELDHQPFMVGDGLSVAGHSDARVRFCIAGSTGRRTTPQNEVRGPSTVAVTRNLRSAGRCDVPDSDSCRGDLMPSSRITTRVWARGFENKIIEAVQSTLLISLKLPDDDRVVVLDLHDEAMRIVPTGRTERYTRIEVVLFAGRSIDAKRAAIKVLVANLAVLGVAETEIKTMLVEVPAEN